MLGEEFRDHLMNMQDMAAAEAAEVVGSEAAAREADFQLRQARLGTEKGSPGPGEAPAKRRAMEARGQVPKWILNEYESWVEQGKVPLVPFRLRDQLQGRAPTEPRGCEGDCGQSLSPAELGATELGRTSARCFEDPDRTGRAHR